MLTVVAVVRVIFTYYTTFNMVSMALSSFNCTPPITTGSY